MATFSMAVIVAAAGTPLALYADYLGLAGVTTTTLAMSTGTYFLAAAAALFFLGRLSDILGRKWLGLSALLLAAVGTFALIFVTGPVQLLLGRTLQGAASGLAASALASWVADSAPAHPGRTAAATAGAPLLGFTSGALWSAALVQSVPQHPALPYVIAIALLTLAACAIVFCPDSVRRQPLATASLRPRLAVDHRAKPLLLGAAAVIATTWAFGSFLQAFTPVIASQQLSLNNRVVMTAVIVTFVFSNALAGALAGRLTASSAVRGGTLVFALSLSAVTLSLAGRAAVGVFLSVAGAGIGAGAGSTGSLRILLVRTSPARRASLFSATSLIAYGGSSLPGFISGEFEAWAGIVPLTGLYALAAFAALVVGWRMSRRSEHETRGAFDLTTEPVNAAPAPGTNPAS